MWESLVDAVVLFSASVNFEPLDMNQRILTWRDEAGYKRGFWDIRSWKVTVEVILGY